MKKKKISKTPGVSKFSNHLAFEKKFFKINFSFSGPQKQLVYKLRFPISYKNNQSLSQRVLFTNYFDWMGQSREYSLRPILSEILKLTRRGEWGLVTNSVKLEIFDHLKANDVVEVRLWLDKISGRDNIYHLFFDWFKYTNRNFFERVAFSTLVFTCVDIVEHGRAMIAKPPKFLKDYLNDMAPKVSERVPLSRYKSRLVDLDIGNQIAGPVVNSELPFRSVFQTTLENSNLIGNLYFSNYPKWANTTKDLYLYKLVPSLFKKNKFKGEFATLACKINYLLEAMPFDTIIIDLNIDKLFTKGMLLKYDVYKRTTDGDLFKVADISQTIVFVEYASSLVQSVPIPIEILKKLKM